MTRQELALQCELLANDCEQLAPYAAVVLLVLAAKIHDGSEQEFSKIAISEARRAIHVIDQARRN